MFDPIKFFQPAYLFDLRPFTSGRTIEIMMIFFGILILLGLGVKIFQTIKKSEKFQDKLYSKIVSLLVAMGILGIGLAWIRYERVQILSARFWLVVWAIIFVAWLYPIVKYCIKVMPQAKKSSEEKKLLQKYLPKKQ